MKQVSKQLTVYVAFYFKLTLYWTQIKKKNNIILNNFCVHLIGTNEFHFCPIMQSYSLFITIQGFLICYGELVIQLFMGQMGHHLLHQNMNTHPFQLQWKSSSICLHFWPIEMLGQEPSRALFRPGQNPGLIARVSILHRLIGLWSHLYKQQNPHCRLLNKY